MALTYPGDIDARLISSIYSDFVPDDVWVAARHAWVFLSWLGGARVRSLVFKGVNDDRGWFLLKKIPYLQKNIIHVGRSKFQGSMLSLPFQLWYAVISLQLEVGPIIIGLVIGGVAVLEDKWGYVLGSDNMCGLIIRVDVMAVKEEDVCIELSISTGSTEETHCLHPAIPVHIYRRCVVD